MTNTILNPIPHHSESSALVMASPGGKATIRPKNRGDLCPLKSFTNIMRFIAPQKHRGFMRLSRNTRLQQSLGQSLAKLLTDLKRDDFYPGQIRSLTYHSCFCLRNLGVHFREQFCS